MNMLNTARQYADMGICVIPLRPRDKTPARKWRQWMTRRPTDAELQAMFNGHADANIAVVCGGVSGGLVVRDFDDATAYDLWAAEYPALAETLPTVRTARGYHVYARTMGTTRTRTYDDGELRGDGAYVVAPPSVHPSGVAYQWLRPLDEIPVVDLAEAGLDVGSAVGAESAVSACHPVPTVRAVLTEPTVLTALPSVAEAIRRTIPPNIGWRERCLFRLARELQAMPEYAGADPLTLEPVFRAWYSAAEPYIGTKEYAVSFAAFIRAWNNVKVPKGETAVHAAYSRVLDADLSWVPPTIDHEAMRRLTALCRELQAVVGDKPFFLDCRTAAELLGVSAKTAWQWLDSLCVLGILAKVSSGSLKNRKANEYRYRGDV